MEPTLYGSVDAAPVSAYARPAEWYGLLFWFGRELRNFQSVGEPADLDHQRRHHKLQRYAALRFVGAVSADSSEPLQARSHDHGWRQSIDGHDRNHRPFSSDAGMGIRPEHVCATH